MEIFRDEEERTFSTLAAIIYAFQTYDPMPTHLHKTKTKIMSAAKLILETRFSFSTIVENFPTIQKYLCVWLRDLNMLNSYQIILLESVSLIFDRTTSSFRICTIEGGFPHLIVHLYDRLKSYQKFLKDAVLDSFFADFDYTFKTAYNLANCSLYRYDEVHYVSKDAYSLVASEKINPADVIKREYFKLSIPKFNISEILIEIFHLLHGLAFFKVNSGSLSDSTALVETVFHNISEGDYKILELGRSLMFPLLRTGDFKVCSIDDAGAVLTFTETNDVRLEICSLDETSWVTQWKSCLQNHDEKAANDSSFIKTHMEFNGGNDVDKYNNGLGLIVKNKDLIEGSMIAPTTYKNSQLSNGCLLHRSKPLQIPLSSVVQEGFDDDDSLYDCTSVDGESSFGSLSGSESIISDYGFHISSPTNNQAPSSFLKHNPIEVEITDESTVISVENIQISRWSNNSWQKVSPHDLQICIIQMRMGNFLIAYCPGYKNLNRFIIRLCDDIKCKRSTDQDIQLLVPSETIMCNLTGILNIRSRDTEKLLSVLNFYTTDHPETMSHSSTMDNMSSPLSSVSSAIDLKLSLQKCSSIAIPQELTQDVTS